MKNQRVELQRITDTIRQRSATSRQDYLAKLAHARQIGPQRDAMPCSNLAHGMAACSASGKDKLTDTQVPNIAIVSAYNDMLSAHQPYERFPDIIRAAADERGAMAQFAGGVPAMCDGVTQGQDGMDLSLYSRDLIAMSTAIALSHNLFDATICLGICDKIVPGLLIGALAFGHLPTIFLPAGPMPSGLPNKEKARVREAFAAGDADRDQLIAAESASYHSPGTCTFYGTANTNQMLMEFMGLQLPGGSFVNPNTPLRDALTVAGTQQVLTLTDQLGSYTPIGRIVDEAAIVNGIVGLLATGGSTNHTLHLCAIAAAAGIKITWSDFAELSAIVPLLARVYPSGLADVNEFHEAGGLAYIIAQLLQAGLLHDDVATIAGQGLTHYTKQPQLTKSGIQWTQPPPQPKDHPVVRPAEHPFDPQGGMNLVTGNIGRAIVKVSAVEPQFRTIEAPARIFHDQNEFIDAFESGTLTGDFVAVVCYQGPRASGMPELHKLTPYLGVLQDRGQRVALLTDGRMSGASGKILAAIQVTPEAEDDGLIGKIAPGDLIRIDGIAGTMSADISAKARPAPHLAPRHTGMGRELFGVFRRTVSDAESGASVL